jgi:hypothetical protein
VPESPGSVEPVERSPRRTDPLPLETDDVMVVGIGTAVWAVLLLGLLPFRARLDAAGHGWWIWTCLVGTLLGLSGLVFSRRRRRSASARGRADERAEPPLREPLP